MKRISTIKLGGRMISIEDNASQMYAEYIETLYHYFSNEAGRLEIMNDIENRAGELMQLSINRSNTCINRMDIENIIRVIGTADDLNEFDKDDWDIFPALFADSNDSKQISLARSIYVLTEYTSVQLEGFKLSSN